MKKIKKSKLISTALGIISLMGAGTLLASCAAEEPLTPPASGQETTPEQQVQQAVAYAIDQARSNDDTKLTLNSFDNLVQDIAKYLKAPESGQADTYATQRQQFDTAVRAIINEVVNQEVKQNFTKSVEDAAKTKLAEGLDAMKVAAQTNAINEAKKVRTKIVDKVFDKVVEGLINASLTALSTEAQSLNEDQKQVIVDSAKASVQNLKTSGLERIGKQIDKVIKTKLVSKNAIDQARSNDDTKLTLNSFDNVVQDIAKFLKAPESDTELDIHKTQRQQFDTAVKKIIDEVVNQEVKQKFTKSVEEAAKTKLAEGLDAMKEAAQANAINEAKKVRTKIVDKVFDKVVEGLINASLTALGAEAQSLSEDQKQAILNNYDNENNAERIKLRGKKLLRIGSMVFKEVQKLIRNDSRSSLNA